MVIDPSLAKGLRKREHRRLTEAFKAVKSFSGKGTRAAWLRRAEREIKRLFGDYICWCNTQGTKPANTEKQFIVVSPTVNDAQYDYVISAIKAIGRNQSIDHIDISIAITHHAFERIIQSFGSINVKTAVIVLHVPIVSMFLTINKRDSFVKDEEFRICSGFGMFIFRVDDDECCVLRTVIKADALEGEKRREWEANIEDLLVAYEGSKGTGSE